MVNEKPTDPLLAAARKHGLRLDREAAFLMWVFIECWEGRELLNFDVLIGKAHALTLRFNTEDDKSEVKHE